ncbi:Integral membrane sensor signal transduction histidine kinase [Gammaproteobacteria bacterium]
MPRYARAGPSYNGIMSNILPPRRIVTVGLLVLVTVLVVWKYAPVRPPVATLFGEHWYWRWNPAESWRPYTIEKPMERSEHEELWLETTLPSDIQPNHVLFVPAYSAYQSFEVALDNHVVYRSSPFSSGLGARHLYHLWHLIDLPYGVAGKRIVFHFFSSHPYFIGLINPPWLGDAPDLLRHFVLSKLPLTILASLFLLIGTASLSAIHFFTDASRAQLSAFAMTALGAGCYLLSESDLYQWIVTTPFLASYLHYLSFFLFIIGLGRYFAPMTDGFNRFTVTWIVRLFSIYPLVASLFDLAGLVSWDTSFDRALWLVMLVACWFSLIVFSSRFHETVSSDYALIRAAFVPMFAAGLFDAAVGLRLIPSGPLLYPWGLLVVMAMLFYRILARDWEERISARLLLEKARHAEETAIAEERRRIARDIHDGLAQDLAMMNMRASIWNHLVRSDPEKMTEEIALFGNLLRKNIGEVRRAIFALRPLDLDGADFLDAMERYVKDFGLYTGLRIRLECTGTGTIPQELEVELYRVIQECLNNTAKHAKASEARVMISVETAGGVLLSVADNGVGFDVASLSHTHRLGLRQLRERVEERGGYFSIRSELGFRTEITIRYSATTSTGETI